MIFVIACVLAVIIVGIMELASKGKAEKHRVQVETDFAEWIKDIGMTIDKRVEFSSPVYELFPLTLVLDNSNEQIGVYGAPYYPLCHLQKEVIEYSKIIGYEIKQDNERRGGMGRGITGTILGGEAGAIIATATNKEEERVINLIIYTSDFNNPSVTLTLSIHIMNNGKGMETLRQANVFLTEVTGHLKAIIYNNEMEMKKDRKHVAVVPLSTQELSDEEGQNAEILTGRLRELKDLRNADLITEEDYQTKKKELLAGL